MTKQGRSENLTFDQGRRRIHEDNIQDTLDFQDRQHELNQAIIHEQHQLNLEIHKKQSQLLKNIAITSTIATLIITIIGALLGAYLTRKSETNLLKMQPHIEQPETDKTQSS